MNPSIQAEMFEANDFHDALVQEVRIIPATELGGTSSVEVTFKDHFNELEGSSVLTIDGCANVSFDIDLDVLTENLYMNVLGFSASVDRAEIRKRITDQISSWNVRYASDPAELYQGSFQPRLVTEADSPLGSKFSKLTTLTLFNIRFFGGNLSVIAQSFHIDRPTAQCTRTPLLREPPCDPES